MELTVVGAGPAWSDRPGAVGACYLVRTGGTSIVLDLGHGAYAGLAGLVEPSAIDAVVVSHLHPDHFVDLVPLRHYLRFGCTPPRRGRVLGPAGLATRLDALHGEPGFAAASLDIEPLAVGVATVGELSLESRLVTHTAESYGFRVAPAGRPAPGLVYSGDCGRDEDLDPLVRPGDAVLVEASFGPGPVDPGALHLDGGSAGRLAARTGARELLLTHLLDWRAADATIAAARRGFDGPIRLVSPGDRVAI
ncbi:MAG: hypothetical protein RL338_415 [Chloroflexota bacterium]